MSEYVPEDGLTCAACGKKITAKQKFTAIVTPTSDDPMKINWYHEECVPK